MYAAGYGANGRGAHVQPLARVPLRARATAIGSGLELAAAATRDGLYVWGVLRTPHGVRHLPAPTHVPGSEALEDVAAIAVLRETVLVLGT